MEINPTSFTEWINFYVKGAGGASAVETATGVRKQTLYKLMRGSFPSAATAEKLGLKFKYTRKRG